MKKAVKIRDSAFWWMGAWLTMNAVTLATLEVMSCLHRRRAMKMLHHCMMFSMREKESQREEKAVQ